MNKNKPDSPLPLSKSKKLIFSVISILIPFIFLIFLELILRISGYGDDFSLFINHPDKEFENYYVVNPEIGKKYFHKMEYSAPGKDMFLKNKPNDVFRIFVMGSSTIVGFPYDNNLMFTRILNERLRDAYPGKKIEIVNTAITAINSFTLADFMPQILDQNPDAILFYAGENEFYGAFGVGSNEAVYYNPVLIRLHLKLLNYKVYQLVVNTIGHITGLFGSKDSAIEKRGTLMSRIVKDANILYGSKTYKTGISNYERNLNNILALAKAKNVTVFISDLVSNLHDLRPFKSISANGLKGADEYFDAAKKYEQQGDIQKAKENYILARDYDCIRFRASSDIYQIITKMTDKYQDHFVPTLELFNANSPNGIIGNNLLVEHVHPNISGEFLLSEAYYKEIVKSKLISTKVDSERVKSFSEFEKDYGYSALDSLIGYHRIANLKYHWPFKDETQNYVDYREIYRPKGTIDSLAFNVMAKQKMSLSQAHELLAEMYQKKGDLINAYREYNCLTEIFPYSGTYFRKAADCLLMMNDLPEALHFFERSTEYGDESFYANFRAGEICMIKNDFANAIIHFQKAQLKADKQEKEKTLVKIYQSLFYLNRLADGKEIAAYFKKVNTGKPINIPKKANTYANYIPLQVKKYVDEAQEFADEKELDRAIDVLLQSLKVKETPVVFRKLGELYYQKGVFGKSQYYLSKAYPEFKFDTQFLQENILSDLGLNQVEKAQMALDQLKKIEPKYPDLQKLQVQIDNHFSQISK